MTNTSRTKYLNQTKEMLRRQAQIDDYNIRVSQMEEKIKRKSTLIAKMQCNTMAHRRALDNIHYMRQYCLFLKRKIDRISDY